MNRTNCHLLVRECATLKQLQQAHAQAITGTLDRQFQPLACKILNSYAQFGEISDAHKVFDIIPDPDLVSITSLMSLHLQSHLPHQSISVFSKALNSGQRPDGFTIATALSASGRIGDMGIGRSVHGLLYRCELGLETVVGNALIDMYCRNGRTRLARMVFDEMRLRDGVSWSSMLHGYVKVDGLDRAMRFFAQMPRRDTISWTVMITGHVQGKHPVRALELFREMKSEGYPPTVITIVGVLSACADIGALDLGRAIHGHINKVNAISDVTLYNALLDMYSKSGSLEMASEVFDGILHKDVYTGTTMISGFAVHGNGERALDIFSEMLSSGIHPNEVTFLAVLLACTHAGFVDEGRAWFDKMKRCYNLKPQLEHYGCMVDLLGRAGLLKEAEKLIGEMGSKPDSVIWRSLLSACLLHSNIELAEIAGKEIINRDPDDDGVYVLLCNIYAASNRREEALEMRKKMRDRKVVKKPGCSWIEVNGVVQEFLVDDKMHCFHREIFLILEGMSTQMEMNSCISFILEDDSSC